MRNDQRNSKRSLDFESNLDQFIGNFVITCNVIDDSCTRFDVYAGARVNLLDAVFDITGTSTVFEASQLKKCNHHACLNGTSAVSSVRT